MDKAVRAVFSWLGQVECRQAWALQTRLVELRLQGRIDDTVLMIEHPHVYTLGRRGSMDDVLLDADALASLGIAVHEVDRGGQTTYHGPGQLVCYPVMDIRSLGGPVRYVRALEAAIIEAMAALGVRGRRKEGMPGVWVGEPTVERKIAAIGLRVSRGVSSHGFALNVNPNLGPFQHVVACGVPGLPVTSLERELGRDVDAAGVRACVATALARCLGLNVRWLSADALGTLAAEGGTPASLR